MTPVFFLPFHQRMVPSSWTQLRSTHKGAILVSWSHSELALSPLLAHVKAWESATSSRFVFCAGHPAPLSQVLTHRRFAWAASLKVTAEQSSSRLAPCIHHLQTCYWETGMGVVNWRPRSRQSFAEVSNWSLSKLTSIRNR
jgi:hypothetical protein